MDLALGIWLALAIYLNQIGNTSTDTIEVGICDTPGSRMFYGHKRCVATASHGEPSQFDLLQRATGHRLPQ